MPIHDGSVCICEIHGRTEKPFIVAIHTILSCKQLEVIRNGATFILSVTLCLVDSYEEEASKEVAIHVRMMFSSVL